MKSESYHQARNIAVKDLAEAVNQVKLLEQRIARLKQTIASLDALIEGEEPICSEVKPETQMSLREACREALKIANGPRTATEVRDWLANSGYELSEQENALASIHTILKRFVKAGEAAAGTNAEGKTTYEWIGERSDSFTSALQQLNYQAAKQASEAVRAIMTTPAAIEHVRRASEQAGRAVAQFAAMQASAEKTQRILTQAEKNKNLLEAITKKR